MKLLSHVRNEGVTGTVQRGLLAGYLNVLRPLFPRVDDYATLNGVRVRQRRLFDTVVPWWTPPGPDDTQYEEGLVSGIRRTVDDGDDVVVVGGGWGVSTIAAAQQVGANGYVTVYEGGTREVENVVEAVRLNGLEERVEVKHGIVGEAVSLRSASTDAPVVHPNDLPDSDVLVLDCEGAEKTILGERDTLPPTILVETHGVYGAPTDAIETTLRERGYVVEDPVVAEPSHRQSCLENDVFVLCATRTV